jgi:group I intron endonuclease
MATKNFLFKRLGLLDYSYKNKSGLYLIENLDSNRFYVGSAVDLYKRMHVHICQLKGNYHHNAFLQSDYNSGNNNLVFTVLNLAVKNLLITEEQKYIDLIGGSVFCYNVCQIAGSWLGKTHSDKTKKALSQKAIGRKVSDATKEKIRKSHAGKPLSLDHPIRLGHTEQSKIRISNSMLGNKNHFYGKTHSNKTKTLIREKLLGNYHGPRTRVKAVNKKSGEIMIFDSMSTAGKKLGISQSYISQACAGKIKNNKPWNFEIIKEE